MRERGGRGERDIHTDRQIERERERERESVLHRFSLMDMTSHTLRMSFRPIRFINLLDVPIVNE